MLAIQVALVLGPVALALAVVLVVLAQDTKM